MKKMQKGFTLIELMIVVAIIGILSAFAVPAYQNYVAKAEANTGLGELAALKTNVEDHIMNNGAFPATPATVNGSANGSKGTIGFDPKKYTMTYTFANATPDVNTKTIVLSRDMSSGVWTCKTTITNTKIKPNNC